MIHVLQLLATECDFQTERSLSILSRQVGAGFQLTSTTIGRAGTFRNGVTAILQLRQGDLASVDLIHAWGEKALTSAAMGGTRPIVYSPIEFATNRQIDWLRSVMNYRAVHVISSTSTQRRLFVERGIPLANCHLIRPGVEFARINRRRDPELRRKLGFAESDFVLLAAGESVRNAGHEVAILSVAVLNKLDPKYKLLIWGRGGQTEPARRLTDKLKETQTIRFADQLLGQPIDYEQLLPAADMVLVTAKGPVATLPLCISMAAALPIVSTVTPIVSELLEDRHTALMVSKSSPRTLAQRVLDFMADAQLQWSIADMARTEAFEYFTMTRFVNQYRAIYRQIVEGQKVELAETAPGAGQRFHGLGLPMA